jgi:hypothetical protein
MSTNPRIPAPHDLAAEALSEVKVGGVGVEAVPGVSEAVRDASAAITQGINAAGKLNEELAAIEHQRQRGTLPALGVQTLKTEARAEAEQARQEALRKVDANVKVAEALLIDNLQPTVTNDTQVLLGRQTLALTLGDEATGKEFAARVVGMASDKHADPQALALIGTPWFRSLAISKGVPNVDQLVVDAQRATAESAGDRPGAPEFRRQRSEALKSLQGLKDAALAVGYAFNIAD